MMHNSLYLNRMKNLFFFKIFLIFYFFGNLIVFASTQTKIIANVGNQIVSSYELKNKVNTILFLSNQKVNQININNVKNQALITLVNSKLKKIEIKNYGIPIEKNENVNKFLSRSSSRFNTDENGLKKLFEENNIDFDLYLDEIMIDLAWQKLIFSLYNDKIVLDENEINNELDKIIKEQRKIKEYELAEIEISLDQGSNIDKKINEIKDEINKIGFENTAIKFSASSSALEGGKLGWVNSNAMSKEIYDLIKNIEVGGITNPIIKPNNLLFLKLLNERSVEVKNIDINKTKNRIIAGKKNELFTLYSNNRLSKLKNNTLINIQ